MFVLRADNWKMRSASCENQGNSQLQTDLK